MLWLLPYFYVVNLWLDLVCALGLRSNSYFTVQMGRRPMSLSITLKIRLKNTQHKVPEATYCTAACCSLAQKHGKWHTTCKVNNITCNLANPRTWSKIIEQINHKWICSANNKNSYNILQNIHSPINCCSNVCCLPILPFLNYLKEL